ncbi:MAG: isoprenyl transferase [Bacteroidaceae bacterium]|nr:isoprenyl transferase [Bacteroidaceae bacterium]
MPNCNINHLAIIMDGNGRWATRQGMPRPFGHAAGVETVKRITEECSRRGIKYLTLYTFSTENWQRPAAEVKALMDLLLEHLTEELFVRNNARFRMIGDRTMLPTEVAQHVRYMEDLTRNNTGISLVVALSYSSRWELTKAMKDIAQEVKDGKLDTQDINEDTISKHLETEFMDDPDLLIRTGGECRISNYLLWQIAYSELYFTDTYWPDFTAEDLDKAIGYFNSKQRRFGKTGQQIEEENTKHNEE